MRKTLFLLIVGFTGAWTTAPQADSTLRFSAGDGQTPNTMYVRDGKVRMEGAGGASIFDTGAGRMVMLNEQQRAYRVMDDASMKEQLDAMSAARQQMLEKMKSMPPEQRQMLEQRMPGFAAESKAAPKITTRDTGKADTVAGIPCRVHEALQDGKAIGTACIATREDLGMSAADFKALKDMFAYTQKTARHGGRHRRRGGTGVRPEPAGRR